MCTNSKERPRRAADHSPPAIAAVMEEYSYTYLYPPSGPHHGPGVDPVCNKYEYQEYLLGVKIGRCVRLTTLPPSGAIVT